MSRIFNAAAGYTLLGLLAGLFFREFAKYTHATETGQLGLVHTHFLTLGTLVFLIVLGLEKLFSLTSSKWFRWFEITYHAGLLITASMMIFRGIQSSLGQDATGAAIAGIAGIGHILLTAGLVFFFVALRGRIREGSSHVR